MEIELKYSIPNSQIADEIWENQLFKGVEEKESREDEFLHAKYFDTEQYDLLAEEIAYRVRQEGERYVAALKWKGHSDDGLHVREEINVPVDSNEPDLTVFRESNMGASVLSYVNDKPITCILETKVKRRSFRIDTDKGIYEFSIDEGEIVCGDKSELISEVEIELFSGEEKELLQIGKKVQETYGLEPENESKYARGIKLLKE